MKTSLRVLALFMSLLMLVSVFASCTSKDPEETKAPDKEQNETSKETPKATDDEGNSESATDKPEHVHTEVTDPAKEPTCSETGLTEGKHCSECNEILVSQKTVDKKPHTEATIPAKDSTCKETGLTEGKYCSVCNEPITKQEIVPVKPHTEAIIPAKDSTCKETGLTEGKYCSVCNEIIIAQTIIPEKGHKRVTDSAVAPTFNSTGLTEGAHCSVCNTVILAQLVIPALIPGEYSITYRNIKGNIAPTPNTYKENEGVIWLPEISATGYTFKGWFTAQNGGDKVTSIDASQAKNIILYAQWEAITYSVQYINGEGHGNVTEYNVENGIIVLKKPTVPKKGYTFKGWFTAETGGEKVTSIDASQAKNLILYAQWETKTYTVQYINGEGHGNITEYNIEDGIIVLKKPTVPKKGYTFKGWFTDQGDKVTSIYASQAEDIILYAQWTPVRYNINYYEGTGHNNPTSYTIEDSTIKLKDPVEPTGYTFAGWFTDKDEKINFIYTDSCQEYNLTAKYNARKYTITFVDAPKYTTLEYTIENEITLPTPEWFGLDFIEWRKDGKACNKITKGTIGNLTVTAIWQTRENKIYPANKNNDFMVAFDGKNYHMIHELGTIRNVVLDGFKFYRHKNENMPIELEWSDTITVNENVAKAIAVTTSESVSKSEGLQKARNWKNTLGASFNGSKSIGIGVEMITAKIEQSLNITAQGEWGNETVTSKEVEEVNGTQNSSSSTIQYAKEITSTVKEKLEIPADMPAGFYGYAHAGDIKVYAILTYDPSVNEYSISTFSYLSNTYSELMYYPNDPYMCERPTERLEYDIPMEDINKFFSNGLYTIKYNSNGGQGTMPESIFSINMEQNLYPNAFERNGYTFSGWELRKGNSTSILSDKQAVSKLAGADETITLYAHWTANNYTVTFDANGGGVSPKTKTVTYNSTYGTLPTPTKTGHTGVWTLNGNEVTSKTSVTTARDHTLTARWTENKYTITFVTNGGSSVNTLTYNYGATTIAPTNPTRAGYDFTGWTFNDASFKFGNSMPAQNIVATANWKFKTVTCTDTTKKTISDEGHYGFTSDKMTKIDLSELKPFLNSNYTIKFYVSLNISEKDDGYQEICLHKTNTHYPKSETESKNFTDEEAKAKGWIITERIEHGPGEKLSDTKNHEFSWKISGENLTSIMYLRYDAIGEGEDVWYLHGIKVTISVIKK